MVDFLKISERLVKGRLEIYPTFIVRKSSDLMIRGGDFYAIWNEENGYWSTDEDDVIHIVDQELDNYVKENKDKFDTKPKILYMWDSGTKMIDSFHKFCKEQMRDNYHMLDEKLIFSNDPTSKKDYASKRLPYPLKKGPIPNYEKLISTLYDPEEREKLEWAIGSIVAGDSKTVQKFIVLYGAPGSGKSTILNIIQKLFDGYTAVFDAKALGSANNAFALEAFRTNPLVAIQHDGDLSRIEDNTRLNSLVSHEFMTVNEKFKSTYSSRFKSFLFMGTNKPVKITDAKSGIIRRLIDVVPSGEKLSLADYKKLTKAVDFELGGIAAHCKDIYLADPEKYEDYVPRRMMVASNDFYNFMLDSYFTFKEEDGVSLKVAWDMYKVYCDDAKITYPLSKRVFKEELRDYFDEFVDRFTDEEGNRTRNYYYGFKYQKFEADTQQKKPRKKSDLNYIDFKIQPSYFDNLCKEYPAQYANTNETPSYSWSKVTSKLKDINTSELHYVKVPENHIVIDFDIPNESGEKDFKANLIEASKWPPTYAELSKSGKGIHLHYIWTGGDPTKLSRIFDDRIEVKVFTGNSSLRRKLSECNDLPIAELSSGLPLKGENKVVNFEGISNAKSLKTIIKRCLNKEYDKMPSTKQNIDFIYKILEDAYNSDLKYDVTDLRNDVTVFAANSTHNSDYCMKLVAKMHFRSEEASDDIPINEEKNIFYDIEVFPNLLLVNWKWEGDDKPVVRMINPTMSEIEELCQHRLIGFNCRRYDNHILYARMMGYDNQAIFELSKKIITEQRGFFAEAYNLSYTDVYDFCTKKQSLKKWEIELGIHHLELGLPWDQEVPEDMWEQVAEYCDNDVIATEATFNYNQGDWTARQIQVELAKSLHGISNVTVNDTTNTLSAKIIFGNNKAPQSVFNYRNLGEPVSYKRYSEYREKFGPDYVFRIFDENGLPAYETYDGKSELPKGYSILPFFPGYKFEIEKKLVKKTDSDGVEDQFDRGSWKFVPTSTYLGDVVGEGGRVYSNPGMWNDIWDGDVSSMHPHSAIYECLFGPEYTKIFKDIVDARVAIKHKDFDKAGEMFNGALKPYLNEQYASGLAQALKIVINSIYGLTSAKFSNVFKDPRNTDNIVAKRGALFMTLLKQQVEKWGYTVAHIKTDSIKIPNATKEIQDFVIRFGKEYGYSFETEAEFSKFCLVNDAVYIAKYKEPLIDKATKKEIWWTATGKQFAVPYVFKKLFSHENIKFEDMCETFQVTSSLYLDMNEDLPDVTDLEARYSKLEKDWKKYNDPLARKFKVEMDEIKPKIDEGHNYRYIGKIGLFTPVKPGTGGGVLVRESKDKNGNVKYDSASGAKGYRWLESETVKQLGLQKQIDRSFYDAQVDAAIETIAKFGDFEWFSS